MLQEEAIARLLCKPVARSEACFHVYMCERVCKLTMRMRALAEQPYLISGKVYLAASCLYAASGPSNKRRLEPPLGMPLQQHLAMRGDMRHTCATRRSADNIAPSVNVAATSSHRSNKLSATRRALADRRRASNMYTRSATSNGSQCSRRKSMSKSKSKTSRGGGGTLHCKRFVANLYLDSIAYHYQHSANEKLTLLSSCFHQSHYCYHYGFQ